MRSGRRLAIDVGKVRIGVAASDFHAILASGIETVPRTNELKSAIDSVLQLISQIEPIEIYVGLPISMSGASTESTSDAILFAKEISTRAGLPIRMVDERLSTVTAANALKTSGRDSKSGRKIIDQIAASVILEQAMETERLTGLIPGRALEDFDE